MLYREINAVCSQIHTKHINTLCGQNVGFLYVKLVVHIVTITLQIVKEICHVTVVVHKAVRDTVVCEKWVHFYQTTRRQPPEGSAAPRCPTSHLA